MIDPVIKLFKTFGRLREFNTYRDLIVFFTNQLQEIFPESEIEWIENQDHLENRHVFPIEIEDKHFGYLTFNNNKNIKSVLEYIRNSMGVLALAFDKIDRDRYIQSSNSITQPGEGYIKDNKTIEQQELDFFFANSLDLLCIANTDGYFIKLSKEWERTLGYKTEELIGKKLLDFVHPDDLQSTLNAIADLSSQKKVLNFHNRYQTKDGNYRIIEWRSNPYGSLIFAAARDITDRIVMEQSLRESEERNKIISSLTTDYIFKLIIGEKGSLTFEYVSDNFHSITGRTIKEVQDINSWKSFIHPDDYPDLINLLKRILNEGILGEIECRSYAKGKIRWLHIVASPEIDPSSGCVKSITGAVKDISFRKNIEMQLRFSEEKFQKAFLCTPDAVTIASCSDGRYIEVNEVFLQMTGYSRDEVIGKLSNELNLWVNEEEMNYMRSTLRDYGHLPSFEAKFRMRSGEIRSCVLTGEIIEVSNEKCSLLFVHDITEQKKSEEEIRISEFKFRSIFENSTVGIALVGLDGKYLMVNESLCRIMGYSIDELMEKSFYDLTHPEDIELSSNMQNTIFRGEKREYNFNKRYIHKTGKTIWTEVSSRFIHDDKSNPLYFITHVKDITERIFTEKQIRESEEKFRIAFDNAPTGMSIISADEFRYIAVNPLLCEMFGYTTDDFLKNSIQLVTHPDDVEKSNEWIRKKLNNEPCEADFEKRFIRKDGKIVWGLVRSQWIRNEDGSPRMAVTHILDITKRKLAEEALHTSENLMKSIFRAAPTGIGTIRDRVILEANDKLCDIIGYDHDELIGKNARMLYMTDEDFNFYGKLQYRQILESGSSTFETRWKRKDNTVIDILLSSSPIDISDLQKGFTSTILDITSRKQAERSLLKFQYSFEHAPTAVYWINREGNIVYGNNHACQSLKYNRDELLNMHIWDIDPSYSKETWFLKWNQNTPKKPDEKSEHVESLHKRKDNTLFPVEITSRHLWFENEELLISFVHDITEFKQAELMIRQKNAIIETQNEEYKQLNIALQKAKEKAEESDRLKTAFLQNMSHEIRTPMNAIVGFSDLLQSEPYDPEMIARYTKIINQRSNDLLSIINDILDIARIESGLIPVNNEYCNIKELFVELTDFFKEYRVRMEKEHIGFEMIADCASSELGIKTDMIKLKQIFINLISNAFKFTTKGKVEGGCKLDENNKLIFYVTDTGIGIPADKQKLVFQRFFQLNYNLSSSFSGTGLGLSIVKGLLSLLNGQIWLESEQDKGSTFYFTFEYEKLGNNIKDSTLNTISSSCRFDGKTILVVEDDNYNTLFIKEVLNRTGANVLHTEYGSEAVQMVLENEPDLILMDIRLPDIDGYEAVRQIKKKKPDIGIVAQTAYASQLDRQKAIDAGCSDYISKPINRQLLLSIISSLIS